MVCHWGWVLVGAAVALRFALLEFALPDFPISIEDLQLAGDGMRALLNDDLALHYRFTTILGLIGFVVADNTLDSFRLFF